MAKGKSKRGFASMPKGKVAEAGRKGGKAKSEEKDLNLDISPL